MRTQQHAPRSIRMFVLPDLRPGETAASTTARSTGTGSSSTLFAPPIKHGGCRGPQTSRAGLLAGRLRWMISLGHFRAVALLGSKFERGLEEVHEPRRAA